MVDSMLLSFFHVLLFLYTIIFINYEKGEVDDTRCLFSLQFQDLKKGQAEIKSMLKEVLYQLNKTDKTTPVPEKPLVNIYK